MHGGCCMRHVRTASVCAQLPFWWEYLRVLAAVVGQVQREGYENNGREAARRACASTHIKRSHTHTHTRHGWVAAHAASLPSRALLMQQRPASLLPASPVVAVGWPDRVRGKRRQEAPRRAPISRAGITGHAPRAHTRTHQEREGMHSFSHTSRCNKWGRHGRPCWRPRCDRLRTISPP